MSNTVNLSDPKLYKLVDENVNTTVEAPVEQKENKNIMVIVEKNRECHNPLMKFLTMAFVIALVVFLIYITVYRFVLGYNFFKNKDYMKSAAAFSPELLALSTSILL